MRDESLIEPFAAVEIFCDGFTDFKIRNGIMSCVGYRLQEPARETGEPLKAIVIRLIFPRDCVPAAIVEAQDAMNALPVTVQSGVVRKAH